MLWECGLARLYQCGDNLVAVSRQQIDDGYLGHRVAARLQAHGGSSHVDQHLCREGGVIDAHIELETLILRLAAHAFPYHVYAMSHVFHFVYRGHRGLP